MRARIIAHTAGLALAGGSRTYSVIILWGTGTQCTPKIWRHISLTESGAVEMRKMQERSEVILERRTRAAGERWFMSADDILGKNVVNQLGEDLGEISDMRIGFPEGRVQYLVLRYGGILGMAAKRFAVPPESMVYRPGEDNFVVNIDKQRLDNEPGFEEDNWPEEADYSLIQSAGTMTPPTREEAEAMRREEPPPSEIVTTERVERRTPPR